MKTKILIVAMVAGLFIKCKEENLKVNVELKKANLSFEKIIVNGKTISTFELLQKIKGKDKEGFTIKNITISDANIAEVRGSKPNFSITIKKAGTFKIILVLEKKGFEDATVEGQITINKDFIFSKLTIRDGAKIITKNEILGQIRGLTNLDYTIKNIIINHPDFAEVEGSKPNLKIKIKKTGNFTAKIILEKTGFLDVAIQNCEFEIGNKIFTFEKITKNDGNKIITKTEILAQIRGLTNLDYQIKSIEIPLEKSDFAEVKNDFSIEIKKAGNFTAKIILEKTGFLDVEIVNCEFEITTSLKSSHSPILNFSKLTIGDGAKIITKNEILGQITGLTNLDYQIKSIEIPLEKSDFAEVKNDFSIEIKKAGIFTANIILEKSGKQDIVLNDCEFEVQNKSFTFQKLTKTNGEKMIMKNEILAKIQGEKGGYQIKNIEIPAAKSDFAEAKNDFSIEIKKAGIFTANIILEKVGFLDVAIQNCAFEIQNKSFIFQKITKTNGEKIVMKNEILAKIQGEKGGYQIKNIEIPAAKSDFAEVKNDFSIKIKKAGIFTANILLEKVGFLDVVLNNCAFEISNPIFSFQKITKNDGNATINKYEILAQIRGGNGYTIKDITAPLPQALWNGTTLSVKQAGSFMATILLEKVGFLDVVLNNCEFEIQTPRPIFKKFKTTLDKRTITTNQILGQIRGGNGWTIKSIEIPAAKSDFAELKNDFSILIKKVGNFTAKIILKKDGFLDVAIQNCEFEIKNFIFQALHRTDGKKTITTNEILAQIQGRKDGYQIKNINITETDKAEVRGSKSNFSILIKKVGIFRAKITLEKSGFLDVVLDNCEFEIRNPNVRFSKFIGNDGNKTISNAQILRQISGLSGLGYTLKSLSGIPSSFGNVSGTKPNFSINIKKVGIFRAKITLEKSGFLDVVLDNCEFEIALPKMKFKKFIRKFSDLPVLIQPNSKGIYYSEILPNIQGRGGYVIPGDPLDSGILIPWSQYNVAAPVASTDPGVLATIWIKKQGNFTAKIKMMQTGYFTVSLTGCEFYIQGAGDYDQFKKYAKNTLHYDDIKAEYYAYGRYNYGFSREKAKHYAYAKSDLSYNNLKAEYYANARVDFGYDVQKAKYYSERRLAGGSKSIEQAKAYAYARVDLSYPHNVATYYEKARAIYKFDIQKAKYYVYGIVNLKYNYSSDKPRHYAYARSDLGYGIQRAKHYTYARSAFGLDYSSQKAEYYSYARFNLAYSSQKAQYFVFARVNLGADGESWGEPKAKYYAYGRSDLGYDMPKAIYYARAREDIGFSSVRAQHYAQGRHDLNMDDTDARAYAIRMVP